jgi:2-iminobutanoate/2-iminopropanoate deaminase
MSRPPPDKEAVVPVSYSNPPGVAAPIGLYSQVARLGGGEHDLVFVAGQLSVDARGDSVGPGDFPAQMRQVFANLGAVLAAEGLGFENIAQMTTYLRGEDLIGEFYRVREELFGEIFPEGAFPPNTLLVISRLVRPEFLIEVQCIAAA